MNTHSLPNGTPDPLTVLRLPARLDAAQTARLLGFAEHDIQILLQAKLLHPLGKPARNAPKRFALIEIETLCTDRQWLDAATKRLGQYWKNKRLRSVGAGHSPEP